ncbi:MAG: HD domain-containing protein [Acidobacteriaceae bacterium]|nr:HD domain-containing protein [Acidobacteriaceae bacterium]
MIPLDDVAMGRLARSWMLRAKQHDVHFYRHSLHLGELARGFCNFLHFSVEDTKRIEIAALLHDIGKLSIPTKVLSKATSLSDEEVRLIRTHPDQGHRLLAEVEGIDELVRIVARDHHERLDGTGYPRGLLASSIPVEVRIVTLCDVFGAMTEERPYGVPMGVAEAVQRMKAKQTRLDQALLEHFTKMIWTRALPSVE